MKKKNSSKLSNSSSSLLKQKISHAVGNSKSVSKSLITTSHSTKNIFVLNDIRKKSATKDGAMIKSRSNSVTSLKTNANKPQNQQMKNKDSKKSTMQQFIHAKLSSSKQPVINATKVDTRTFDLSKRRNPLIQAQPQMKNFNAKYDNGSKVTLILWHDLKFRQLQIIQKIKRTFNGKQAEKKSVEYRMQSHFQQNTTSKQIDRTSSTLLFSIEQDQQMVFNLTDFNGFQIQYCNRSNGEVHHNEVKASQNQKQNSQKLDSKDLKGESNHNIERNTSSIGQSGYYVISHSNTVQISNEKIAKYLVQEIQSLEKDGLKESQILGNILKRRLKQRTSNKALGKDVQSTTECFFMILKTQKLGPDNQKKITTFNMNDFFESKTKNTSLGPEKRTIEKLKTENIQSSSFNKVSFNTSELFRKLY